MDKRIKLLSQVYAAHRNLVDFYHDKTQDENTPLLTFCKAFVDFINALKPAKSKKRYEYIFTPAPNLNDKNTLNAHLFTAAEYANTLINRINENPTLNLRNEVVGVVFDYAKILASVENLYGISFGDFAGNRNMQVDSYTSYKIAAQLFWGVRQLQRSNSLNGYAIFALRQAIELAGKELLGIENILNKDGQIFIRGTQIPWDFITINKSASYLSFPFNPDEIKIIFKWSNHFVHTGRDAFCFATALALNTVKGLYQMKPIVGFRGEETFQRINEIHDYKSLKKEFEIFLKNKFPDKQKTVTWAPSPQLSAVLG